MRTLLFIIALTSLFHTTGCTQKASFDLFTYISPAGFSKEIKQTYIAYAQVEKTGSWCQLALYKGVPSQGNIYNDFNAEWKTLVATPNNISTTPAIDTVAKANGWEIASGATHYTFDGGDAIALLTTFSGYNTRLSVLAKTNDKNRMETIYAFLNSIDLQQPATSTNTTPNALNTPSAAIKDGFTFNTTHWDDGWTSTVQPDWVEVSKGSIKVLLHYATPIHAANTDCDVICSAAWNTLVANRYSNMRDYKSAPNVLGSERPYLAQAYVTNSAGATVYVTLFSKGKSGWLEIICPDKASFVNAFGVDIDKINFYTDNKLFDPLQKIAGYNKFAIAQTDFTGKWTNNFGGNTYYANIYTGLSAGMSSYSSNQEFQFSSNQTYSWKIIAANSRNGVSNFAQGKGNGTFKVSDNWHIYFSDIEGKPKTYAAQFLAVKGGRVLLLDGTLFSKAR
ncbi:hypothetical protein SAMN05421788_101963 [Filimonas lacunae]|uniref:Uncharacterized protein n=1 Tax=Filimonas lacunae TaxID=477680 RepID=A0A173MQ12_9BACT|nr:hypothetical protein [Filimonas lacunae]BAV09530.1 hypothetical protein FLA_5579 [Filimonas lacunae]SIS74715.1 hypothetical protein SAMN05421788_101963 [Filimonas lacunae]